ncbi:hypothetical protein HYPSUDRAFT_209700 [Hypholoma sublateritium FD-334 SS-4]|uniref:Uncharacterized protein n=1 Tax=Hypholoma sublateritium (strain FD-334 SS-4) TaxID=945553 RepID=A0A0D2N227_HYPSF|nr:hypothetical protein HYPSUDRAFT_209700 [Hypholoma sublateritium FD-334 SS-4]
MQTEFSPLPSESPGDMGGYGATPDPEDPESSDDEGGGEAPADPFVVESMPHPVVLRGAAASWGDRQLSYSAAHISIQQIANWITAEGASSAVATESGDPYTLQAAVGAFCRAANAVPWANPVPVVAPSPAPMDTGDDGPPTPTPKRSAAPLGVAGRTQKPRAVPLGPARPLKAPHPDPMGLGGGDVHMSATTSVPVTTPTAGPQKLQPHPQPRKPLIPHQPPPLNLATKPHKSYAKAVAKAVVAPERVLLEFTDGLVLSSVGGGLLGIYEYLNKQLGIEKFTTRLLSARVTYKGNGY